MGMLENSPSLSDTTESSDAKNTAMVMWLVSIFFGVLSGMLFAFMQRSEPYVQAQAKECINWGVTVLVAIILASIIFGGTGIIAFIVIANTLFALMGAIASSLGSAFAIPMPLRLLR